MISITKNTTDPFVIKYTLEVYTDKELLYSHSVDIGKVGLKDQERDKSARLQLMKEFYSKADIEAIDELSKIIPVYEKDEFENNDKENG